MRRNSSLYASSFSFGPGPLSTALKALIGANVVMFLGQFFFSIVTDVLGLRPIFVVRYFWVWQLATYRATADAKIATKSDARSVGQWYSTATGKRKASP